MAATCSHLSLSDHDYLCPKHLKRSSYSLRFYSKSSPLSRAEQTSLSTSTMLTDYFDFGYNALLGGEFPGFIETAPELDGWPYGYKGQRDERERVQGIKRDLYSALRDLHWNPMASPSSTLSGRLWDALVKWKLEKYKHPVLVLLDGEYSDNLNRSDLSVKDEVFVQKISSLIDEIGFGAYLATLRFRVNGESHGSSTYIDEVDCVSLSLKYVANLQGVPMTLPDGLQSFPLSITNVAHGRVDIGAPDLVDFDDNYAPRTFLAFEWYRPAILIMPNSGKFVIGNVMSYAPKKLEEQKLDKPTPEQQELIGPLLRECHTCWTISDLTVAIDALTRSALRWKDAGLWVKTVTSNPIVDSIVPASDFVEATKVFGFSLVEPKLRQILNDYPPPYTEKATFLSALISIAQIEEVKDLVGWCEGLLDELFG